MPDLLHAQERDRLLASLRRLLRQVNVDGEPLAGLAQTEEPGAPLLTRDNALAAELMAVPALRAVDPGLADAALGFTAAMMEEVGPPPRGALPLRAPHAEILRADPRDLRVLTPWHEYTGDLAHGVLRQRLRGDGRERDVLHTGNMVRLRLHGGVPGLLGRLSLRPRTLDVEDAVTDQGLQAEGTGVVMWHESTLHLSPAPGLRLVAGTVRYEYRASAADPVLRLTVILKAGAKAGLSQVRLTTALDALSEGAVPFPRISFGRGGTQTRRPDGAFGEEERIAEGPLDSVHLWQAGPEEAAAVLHIRPRAAESVFSLRVSARAGVPHWLVLRHTMPEVPRGGTVTLREDRLLARGVVRGTPEAGLRLLRAPDSLAGRDPGQTTAGPPLVALASVLLNAPAFHPPLPRDRLARLRDILDRHLAALPEAEEEGAALAPDELAPMVLVLDALLRAGGLPRERRRLRGLLGQLAAAASPDGAIGNGLMTHGAAILALARGATLIGEPWVEEALRKAILALSPEGPGLAGVDTSGPASTPALAMLLRGLRTTELLAAGGGIAPGPAAMERLTAVRDLLLGTLSARLRAREDRLEVLPGGAGEPDAASIAALLLAVLSPDEVALAMGGVAA
ncbi:hypothetical protein [Roseomonas indoligenes]|uniref:Uncharacterized protein n=1 Tax=Roseomonas indoligenes TaxID=2820811 RepID=A0A940MXW4_9PROT|nr:hypothetical protein [Pararoseomonas indoligenes]MBP0494121.1 hypothetical protein [Pararoseomonas indoligenes]